MTDEEFTPPVFEPRPATRKVRSSDSELANLREEVRRQVLRDHARESRPRRVPLDPAFLAARDEFRVRWDAIWKEGQDKGYLVWEGSYEGEYVVDDATERENGTEFTETAAEYAKRIDDLVDRRVSSIIHNASRRY